MRAAQESSSKNPSYRLKRPPYQVYAQLSVIVRWGRWSVVGGGGCVHHNSDISTGTTNHETDSERSQSERNEELPAFIPVISTAKIIEILLYTLVRLFKIIFLFHF